MKHVFYLLFSFVFLAIAVKSAESQFGLNSKHVNLSIETAFLFDPKDTYYDVSLLRTFRGFLDSLQNAMESKMNLRTLPKEHYSLPEFLYELGGYLIGYTDENIKTFAFSLKDVVEDYFPAGTIYHKIFYDPRLKAFVKNTLTEWVATDPKVLRGGIKAMYQGPTYEEVFIDLVEALTIIFDEETDSPIFRKLVKKFEKFPTKKQILEKNIDAALNFIVFKRYEKLNSTMRSFVIEELSKVAEYVAVTFKERSHDPEFFLIRKGFRGSNVSYPSSSDDSKSSESTQEIMQRGLDILGGSASRESKTHNLKKNTQNMNNFVKNNLNNLKKNTQNMNNLKKNNLHNLKKNTYNINNLEKNNLNNFKKNTHYMRNSENTHIKNNLKQNTLTATYNNNVKDITEENIVDNMNSRNNMINATVQKIAEDMMARPLKELAGNARKIFEPNGLNSFERITRSSSEEMTTEKKHDTEEEIPKEIVVENAFEINVRKNNKENILKPIGQDEDLIDLDSVMFRV